MYVQPRCALWERETSPAGQQTVTGGRKEVSGEAVGRVQVWRSTEERS